MPPAAEANPALDEQAALAESKARSVISYSPDGIFQKSWETYQLVVDVGLLGHSKLASTIVEQLARLRRARGRPLRVLDLGSGDAGCLTRALAAEAAKLSPSPSSSSSPAAAASADFIAQYTGVDESQPALALAEENVRRNLPGTEGRFFVGDLLSAAEQSSPSSSAAAASDPSSSSKSSPPPPPPPAGGYDAIVASLSAHHLPTETGKPALVAAAKRALLAEKEEEKEQGEASTSSPSAPSLLIIADVFLNDDDDDSEDTVDAWRQRSCAVIRDQWPSRVPGGKLSGEEAGRIAGHVGTCDIPTTVANYSLFAQKAGFRRCEKVAEVEPELGIKVVVIS